MLYGKKSNQCILRVKMDDILLDLNKPVVMTDSLYDGCANCNMTPNGHLLENSHTTIGTISGWDRNSPKTTQMTVGEYGRLKQTLSVAGCKDIIVPYNIRKLLGGRHTWIYRHDLDIHCLILSPSVPGAESTVIAVCSAQTNNIECCTVALLELLNIKTYKCTGIEYSFRMNKTYTSSLGTLIRNNPSVVNDNNDNDTTLHLTTHHNSVCATYIAHLENEIEVNHSKFKDRYDIEPLRMLIAMLGGCSLSSFKQFLRNKTIGGLDWITAEMILAESQRNNLSELKSSFEQHRRPPRSLRSFFDLDHIPVGYAVLIDAVFWKRKSGSKESGFKTRGGFMGAVFLVDYCSTMPFAVPIKDLKGTTYKRALRKLLTQFVIVSSRGNNITRLKWIIADQHKTQLREFLEDILDEFNVKLCPARTDTNDMSRLNKTSDTLFRMAHFWCQWGGVPVVDWFWHSFKHACFIYKYIPKATHGTISGKGYSPFTQWYGILTHANFFTAALFTHVICKAKVSDTRGGVDTIFIGVTDDNSAIIVWNPLSNGIRKINSGIFINIQPKPNRLLMIHSGQPIFDESKLLAGKIHFNTAIPGKISWFQYKYSPKSPLFNCWIGHDSRTGIHDKPFVCVCRNYRAGNINTLSNHILQQRKHDDNVRKGNIILTEHTDHPDPFKKPRSYRKQQDNLIAKRNRNAAYDAKVLASFSTASTTPGQHSTAFGPLVRPTTTVSVIEPPEEPVTVPAENVRTDGETKALDTPAHSFRDLEPDQTSPDIEIVDNTGGTLRSKNIIVDLTSNISKTAVDSIVDTDAMLDSIVPSIQRILVSRSSLNISSKYNHFKSDDFYALASADNSGLHGREGIGGERKVIVEDTPISASSIPFPLPATQSVHTKEKGSKKTKRANASKAKQRSSKLAADTTAAKIQRKKKSDDLKRSVLLRDAAKRAKWKALVGTRTSNRNKSNPTPIVACAFEANLRRPKSTSLVEINSTDITGDILHDSLFYHSINTVSTESVEFDNETKSIRANPQECNWTNITAATEDMTLEHVKDAVRSICIDNITQSGLYDALFEVNNTGFTPTPEFWRNNTDNDMTGTDILRSDSPYNENYGDEIIGTSKFTDTSYTNPAPSTIPSFMPVSFNAMLVEQQAKWETAIGNADYNGDDFVAFEPPECEVNQCEAMLRPGVVSGIKFMNSDECRSWLSKLTSANRKGYIPSHSANALKSPLAPFFIEAMMKELASISKLGVFAMKELPKGKKAIPCRFVFDIKWDAAQDKLVKFKARLVAQGFHQREYNAILGIGSYDADGISSPVLKLSSLYSITNLAASLPDMVLMTADVGTAFLAACLATDGTEDVYISLPPPCIVENDGIQIAKQFQGKNRKPATIVKLIKALYGLKNSSAAWFRTIRDYLTSTGFKQSEEDRCVFSMTTDKGSILLGIHVDDMLITGQQAVVENFITNLELFFVDKGSKITKENASHPQGVQFLGSVIKQHKNGIVTLNQQKRIEDVCDRFKIKTYENGPNLPFHPTKVAAWQQYESMPSTDEEKLTTVNRVQQLYNPLLKSYDEVVRHYREYTGNLIWLAGAGCPQVLPIVYKLARYQNNPGILHFEAVRRVLEYLYANRKRSVTFGKQHIEGMTTTQFQQHALTIFTDTSHGDCPITKRSTGGYVVFLFGSLLMMRSFRLSCTTTSTTQSEYYMMSAAAAESIYLMKFYNQTLLPIINNVLKTKHDNLTKIPIMGSSLSDPTNAEPTLASSLSEVALLTSKLSVEAITSLNSRTFPMISESNPIPLYGDNSSAISWAKNGGKKNSKHSMIHASWLWDLIHQRRTITVRKVDTKLNPSDITTKQEGMNAEVFEIHTKALLGELDILPTTIEKVLAHIMVVDQNPMIVSLLQHKSGHTVGIIHSH